MNPDSRVVRGVSIAAIVLSALGILGGLVIALFMGIASTSLNDPLWSMLLSRSWNRQAPPRRLMALRRIRHTTIPA